MATQISQTGLNTGNYASADVPLLDRSQPDKTLANEYHQFSKDLSRMTSAAANLGIETKNESERKKKAEVEYKKRKKEEEDLANKSNAQRLFNLKGGRELPEKETAWSPAAGNIENLEHANDDLRTEYSVLFAQSKINEEQAFINNSAKGFTENWLQEWEALDSSDPLKKDFTKYASLKTIELKSERFADNLNGLLGIKEANKRTEIDYTPFSDEIAKQQQIYIDRKQAEFLDNYVDTDYQGGRGVYGIVGPVGKDSRIHTGPPRTPDELFGLLNRMQAKVNRGNGLEKLYSNDQLHDSIIDNYTQRYELAKTSDDPIFDAQQLFDSANRGMKLTDLKGGIGEKYRKFHKGLYDRFIFLRKAEETAAKDAEKKIGDDLDTIAYGTITDISQLHQEAIDNPGTVTAAQIANLETILLQHDKQGAFSSKSEENEFSEAREQLSAIKKLIDPTSTTYVPVQAEIEALNAFGKTLSNVTTTTELRKMHIVAINEEQNPWLSTQKIVAIDAQRQFLENYSKEDKIGPEQKKQSNSAMWHALKPIQEAHDACINEGKCEKYNTLSAAPPPPDLLEGDHGDYLKKIGKWNEEQGKAGTNTVRVAAAKAASHINQELGAGNFSLLKARKEFQKLKNPTETQIGAFDIAVRQHNEREATKSKKLFIESSLVERGNVFDEIDGVETLQALEDKKGEIQGNLKLTSDDKSILQKKVNTKRKDIKIKVAKDKDISQSADINQQLLNFTDGEITNETLKGIQAKVDGMTWHGNAGNNLRTFITGLIHKNVTAKQAKVAIETYNEHHSAYQTATNNTEQDLNKIVKAVADGILTPEQATTDIDNLEQDFNTNNSALLEAGKKIKYKTNHKALFTKAKKDSGTGDTANKERKKKQKLIEAHRDEVQSLKDYKSDEKLAGISLITKAILLKTPAELITYKENNINFSNDSDAKALFVKEINDLIDKREKGLGFSNEDLNRLSGISKATYLEKIKNSSDITLIKSFIPTIKDDMSLRGQHPGMVINAITDRVLEINKTNTTNDSLTIANNIDKTLFNVPIINQGSLDAAITKAETIKDPEIRRTTISQLRGIKGKLDNRSFNESEFKKKLELKFKTNTYLSNIESKILEHVTKAQHANLNFTVGTSDTTVKTAITDLENIYTTFKSDQVFLDTMEDSGSTAWTDKFTKGIGDLKELQSKISKQEIAKENLDAHNVSLKSREADRTRVQEELLKLQEAYTPEAHTDLEFRIKSFGADYVDEDGVISEVALFKNNIQAKLLRAANVAREKTNEAPKVTDRTTLTTLYTEYADKLSVGGENTQELIIAGKAFLQDEFVAQRVSNSDYKYFENKLNSYNPKAIKVQDGRMRSLETIDSIFRSTHTDPLLSPKLTIPMRGQGSWLEGNQLREAIRSHFDAEWQARADSFKGDKTESYKWATEYAKSLISVDEKINPLDIKLILRIQTWTGGAIDLSNRNAGKGNTGDGNIKPGDKNETDSLVDKILKRN